MKNLIKNITAVLAVLVSSVMLTTAVYANILPEEVQIYENDSLAFHTAIQITADDDTPMDVAANSTGDGYHYRYTTNAKLMGIIPIKNVQVDVIDDMYVAVSGKSFGIKIFTEGVMVVGMNEVDCAGEPVNPAKNAGLEIGDNIISINGKEITSNEDIASIIESSEGKSVQIVFRRDGEENRVSLTPEKSISENKYKAGIWVKDSTAGIGTMTFYSTVNGAFAGLGHGIADSDTGELYTISTGEIVQTNILSINKSVKGDAGEICGVFTDQTTGSLYQNCDSGLYGELYEYDENVQLTKIALKQEIVTGNAQIITSIDNSGPKAYDCVVEKIMLNDATQNMIVRITDENLLNQTGGIVQGMSGSPILQNGRLIGALTHVFVNDPEKGYAVFAETMYKTSQEYAK